jgi:urease accessory protein
MNSGKSWQARLELQFQRSGGRTILARRQHVGPLIVQRPFYPEGPTCHVYLVHPPGGIVGGDALSLQVDVESDAHALLTTPAATRFYRAGPHPAATLNQQLTVRNGALEWLPQETIVFDGARARTTTRVDLSGESRFLGWEIACLGRPAIEEGFQSGQLHLDFLLYHDGLPLMLDRMRVVGDSPALAAPWGLGGAQAMGTLLMYPARDVDLAPLRALTGGDARHALSVVDDVLVCRALAREAEAVRELFGALWLQLRESLLGRTAVAPRIWAT